MEHPKLFDPADTLLDRVRALCAGFPECAEIESWGRPTFRAGKKIFVVVGAIMDRPHSLVFKPDPEEHPALLERDDVFVPPYFGPAGWLAIDVGDEIDERQVDWVLVSELLDTSYRQVALKRQLAALDADADAAAPARPANRHRGLTSGTPDTSRSPAR